MTRARVRGVSAGERRQPTAVSLHLGGGARGPPRGGGAAPGTRGAARDAAMRASALRGPRAALAGSGASRARSEKVTQRCARGSRNSVKLRRWGRSWNTLTLSQRRGRGLVLDLRAPHPHSPGIRHEEGRAALPPQCRGHATRGRERRRRLSAGARGPEPPPPAPPPGSSRLAQARAEVWIRRLGKSGAPGGVPEISALEGGGSGEGQGKLPPRPHQPCRAAALTLGVWRETEAQGREDVAVPEW